MSIIILRCFRSSHLRPCRYFQSRISALILNKDRKEKCEDSEIRTEEQQYEHERCKIIPSNTSNSNLFFILVILYLWLETTVDFIKSYKSARMNEIKPRVVSHSLLWRDQHVRVQDRHMYESGGYGESKKYDLEITTPMSQINLDSNSGLADPIITEECLPLYDWQLASYPTCNVIHEVDMLYNQIDENLWFSSDGHYRDVWRWDHPIITPDGDKETFALKTLRYVHGTSERNTDRHRRDAMAMERLTFSKYVINIYAYCSNSGLFEYGDSGTMHSTLSMAKRKGRQIEPVQKLRMATQVAMALTDLHTADNDYISSIVHGDIKADQFVFIDGIYKLNDFNRGRFMRWNVIEDRPCGFTVGNNAGTNRSPEEYKYEEEFEGVDVYSMGNIFYFLLTMEWPFEYVPDSNKARKMVKRGIRSHSESYLRVLNESMDPVEQALLHSINMCQVYDHKKRASARDVVDYLLTSLKEINSSK